MLSAIDYGKEFLIQYFNKRDINAAAALLADDVIWITPDEIRHLRSRKSIRDFIVSALEDDPASYSVDVAATLSVPSLGDANIAVYDINIIPKGKESAVNLRCTFGMHRLDERFEIAYIGMSRKFHRTDVEQIRSFADALPCGVMTLTCVRRDVQPMYASAFFCERLGYEEAIFYDKLYTNPYFMLSDPEQRRMQTLVAEMSSLRNPKPLAMQVHLLHSDGETAIPCHMTIAAAYKTDDQTVLYLIFDEVADLVTEMERRKRKEQREWIAQQEKRLQQETGGAALSRRRSGADASAALPDDTQQEIQEIRRDAERQIAAAEIEANVRVDEALRLAHEEADAAENLIRVQLEKAAREKQAAVEEARRQVEMKYSDALAQEKERQTRENAGLRDEVQQARTRTEETAAENAALKEQLQALEQSRALLEQQIHQNAETARQEREALRAQLVQEKEQALQDAETRSQSMITDLQSRMEKEQAAAAARQTELSNLVTQQQRTLKEQEAVIRRGETDRRLLTKEKDKSLLRLKTLLTGELRGMSSSAAMAGSGDAPDPEEMKKQLAKISKTADEIPLLAQDLSAIADLDTSERKAVQEPFTVSSCLDLARRVIRPQCRAKGIIFSASAASGMPDAVIGNKAGLELAFLCILENAVEGTLSGGHITMSARSDKPVRGSAYYHFTVKDSGAGIPEERLRILFDDPESELAIARKVIAAMGGAIQVRSKEGEGSTFEVRVNLKLQK